MTHEASNAWWILLDTERVHMTRQWLLEQFSSLSIELLLLRLFHRMDSSSVSLLQWPRRSCPFSLEPSRHNRLRVSHRLKYGLPSETETQNKITNVFIDFLLLLLFFICLETSIKVASITLTIETQTENYSDSSSSSSSSSTSDGGAGVWKISSVLSYGKLSSGFFWS